MTDTHPLSARIDAILEVFEADEGELWRVLERIAQAPHRALVSRTPLVSTADATAIAPELIARSIEHPEAIAITRRKKHFMASGRRWRFLKVYDDRSELTYDTVPNRFVAFFLRALLRELRVLLRALPSTSDERLRATKEDGRWLRRRLQTALERSDALRLASRLSHVPHGHLALNHDARYRRVRLAYVDLLGG